MNVIYIYASVVFAYLKGYHIKLHPDVTQCPLHLPEKKQTQANKISQKSTSFCFQTSFTSTMQVFFFIFSKFFWTYPFFCSFYLRISKLNAP